MALPESFAELSAQDLRISPPSHRLHPVSDRSLQFITGDTEFLACHDLLPYGVRSQESVASHLDSQNILPIASEGSDYTLFEIPNDLLTLDRITLGQGSKEISKLVPVYEEVGNLIGKYSREYRMRNLGIKSLAMLRNSGQLVIVPPYHFEPGEDDPTKVIGDFTRSVNEMLSHVLYGRKIVRLVHSSQLGFSHARTES